MNKTQSTDDAGMVIIERWRKLEADIEGLISSFETETNLSVSAIEMNRLAKTADFSIRGDRIKVIINK